MDWLDLLACQGTLKSLLQHHSSKASILPHSAFLMFQLSHPYMTTRKTIVFTIWTCVSKVMSLHFNMLSRSIIAFLPRSKHLLISWLQSPSGVILEPKKTKSVTVSIVSPCICYEVMGPDVMIFIFWMLNFKPAFSLFFYFHQEDLSFLFTFCHTEKRQHKTPLKIFCMLLIFCVFGKMLCRLSLILQADFFFFPAWDLRETLYLS